LGDSGGLAAARILLSDVPPLAKTEAAAGVGLGVGQAPPKTAEPANSSDLDWSTFAGWVNVGVKELEWWPNNWGRSGVFTRPSKLWHTDVECGSEVVQRLSMAVRSGND
jgi:hypothetical protein